jgi:TonB family protein
MCHRHSRKAALLALGLTTGVARAAWAQVPAAGEVKLPVVVQHVDPVYPPSALATRRQAEVMLAVTVDADGHVLKADVLRSGGADLDEAAIAAVRQWTFAPATKDGKPMASRIKVSLHFAPPAPAPDPAVPRVAPTPDPVRTTTTTTSAAVPATADDEDVEDIDIKGHLVRRKLGAADNDVTIGALEAVPRTNASDALKLAPGFLLTNEGGSGHAEQVFLRGFDAHEGQDLEFTVDGVPINDAGNYHGNGYADTHFIIPELIHSVRVLEGPYAPQQGNFAVAGSADYQLGLDRRGLTAEYSVGNFGTQRLLVLYGPADAPTGTFAGAEYYTTNGFGTNRQARRGTAIGQWETALGKHGTLRVNATAYATEFNNAGVVRQDDYAAGTAARRAPGPGE